jgi:hypothetical protein
VARRRQAIEIPPPAAVEVTEHVVYHGWCSECKKWREAPLDVSQQVMGQGRLGVKITSRNGYIWSVSTPTLRYYDYHHSRGHEVGEALLGPEFQGVLGSDFYAAYNSHQGEHQRGSGAFLA